MKEKFLNYKKIIDGMSNKYWILLSLIFIILIFLSFSFQIIYQPYIFAEDGGIFFQNSFDYGIKSIFFTYGGYISLIPRLTSLLSVKIGDIFNSFYLVSFVMKWCSIIYCCFCICYFNSDEFNFAFKNRLTRLLISIFMCLLMSHESFMIYSLTYTHWWSGLFIFLIGLSIINNNKLPNYFLIIISFLSILSSPSTLIIVFALLFYIVYNIIYNKQNIKQNIMKLIILFSAVLLQCYFILNSGGENTNMLFSLHYIFNICIHIIKIFFGNFVYILTFGLMKNCSRTLLAFLGLFIFILITLITNKKDIFSYIYECVCIIFILFLSLYKNDQIYDIPYFWVNWYDSIPITISGFMIICPLFDFYNRIRRKKIMKFYKIYIFIFCSIYFTYYYINVYKPDYQYCKEVFNIEPSVDFDSDKKIEIKIAGGFYPQIPVKDDGDNEE